MLSMLSLSNPRSPELEIRGAVLHAAFEMWAKALNWPSDLKPVLLPATMESGLELFPGLNRVGLHLKAEFVLQAQVQEPPRLISEDSHGGQ